MTPTRTESEQVNGSALEPVVVDSGATSTSTTTPIATTESAESGGDEIVGQLARLTELHRAGGLTDAEFTLAKSRVLQRPGLHVAAPRVSIHRPTRRMVPEIHPRSALRSVSLVALDQVAKRLGATCRPVSEMPVQVALDASGLPTAGGEHVVGGNGRSSSDATRVGDPLSGASD